jgi:hypothetical protein
MLLPVMRNVRFRERCAARRSAGEPQPSIRRDLDVGLKNIRGIILYTLAATGVIVYLVLYSSESKAPDGEPSAFAKATTKGVRVGSSFRWKKGLFESWY